MTTGWAKKHLSALSARNDLPPWFIQAQKEKWDEKAMLAKCAEEVSAALERSGYSQQQKRELASSQDFIFCCAGDFLFLYRLLYRRRS